MEIDPQFVSNVAWINSHHECHNLSISTEVTKAYPPPYSYKVIGQSGHLENVILSEYYYVYEFVKKLDLPHELNDFNWDGKILTFSSGREPITRQTLEKKGIFSERDGEIKENYCAEAL